MNVPIFATIVDMPTIVSATLNDTTLEITVARGGDSPDFVHWHLYYGPTTGIDVDDPGSYTNYVQLTTEENNVGDFDPLDTFLVLVEVAYDGTLSTPTAEYELAAAGGGVSTNIFTTLLILEDD